MTFSGRYCRTTELWTSPGQRPRPLVIGAHSPEMLPIAAEFEAFRDLVGRYSAVGISELAFYFPEAGKHRQTMEKVAAILPELRNDSKSVA